MSSLGSAPAASPTSSKNSATDSGLRAIARSTSRQMTLPEPSQIEFRGLSRYSRGMIDSSTNPLPPKHSRASAACTGARLHTQYFVTAVARRASVRAFWSPPHDSS